MRTSAYEYGQALQSWRGATKMKEVFVSLELATLCNQSFERSLFVAPPGPHRAVIPAGAPVAFVASHQQLEAIKDTELPRPALNDEAAPFRTVHDAWPGRD